jgi:RNA polymerase sigma factor (sigma-70 family)
VASYRDAPDAVVVGRLARDPVALEELFRRHRRAVLGYVARRCQRPADVDDVVAATFLAALESAPRYDPAKGEVRAWLLGIAHNQLALLRRREGRQRDVEGAISGRAELSEDAFNRLVEQISAAQDGAAMQRALEQLPADQREALLLVGSDGLTPKEAATVLGVTDAAFRVRLFRARRAMRAMLPSLAETTSAHPSVPKEVQR